MEVAFTERNLSSVIAPTKKASHRPTDAETPSRGSLDATKSAAPERTFSVNAILLQGGMEPSYVSGEQSCDITV